MLTCVTHSRFIRCVALLCLVVFSLGLPASGQVTLYSTDFEPTTPTVFVAGNTALSGKDGWVVSASGQSAGVASAQPVYGIDSNIVPGLGQTAFIGFNTPTAVSSLYSAFRPAPYSPALTGDTGNSIIRFSATIGLTKSTTTFNDTFRISFYNNGINNDGTARAVLGSIEFPTNTGTSSSNGNIYRGDSTTTTSNTGVEIVYGEAQELLVVINYQTNRWSASWGDSPLFVDAVFRNPSNAAARPLTFGMVAVQWAITTAGSPGNNWMLFDDWNVSAEPLAQMSIGKIESVTNHATLTWSTEIGYSYRVEYSTDLTTWLKTLAGSLITPTASSLNQTFTDPGIISGKRYYRVRRALTGTSGL